MPTLLRNSRCYGLHLLSSAAVLSLPLHAGAADWTHFARSPQRIATAEQLPEDLGAQRWVLSDDAGAPIAFTGQSGVVAYDGRIFATGRIGGQTYIIAAESSSGQLLWKSPIPAAYLESWSTPVVDNMRSAVIIASGRYITALDAATGKLRWQTPLERNVVNASPLITFDLGAANRAFITDYDGFGGSGRLYCINVDAFATQHNPFQPGEIVWSIILGGTSGNTPAYHDGIVYTSSISDPTGTSAGRVQAFPASAAAPPEPLWTFTNPAPHGFFSGAAVRADGPSISIFAASYALYGGQFAANMVKIDGATGQLVWSIPSNRTDATPIPLADGRIVLSSGIHGYGSIPSVQLFQDAGASASLIWDTAIDSWRDLNTNGIMDPGEYLVVGGWTHQPIAQQNASETRLLAGTIAPQAFSACTDLYLLDLDRHPLDPEFILSHISGAGSTPAAAGGRIFAIGQDGLHAIGPAECYANCDRSTAWPTLNVDDFTCFINSFAAAAALPHEAQISHYANCDQSTTAPVLNVDDFTCFINHFAGGCP